MCDIVQRLRQEAFRPPYTFMDAKLLMEAADEIQQLRSLLWDWRHLGYSTKRDAKTDDVLANEECDYLMKMLPC